MRNIGNKTPTSKQEQKNEINADKTSGKKLVQARLPFKIIPPGSSPASVAAVGDISTDAVPESAQVGDAAECISTQDARKRKLSYEHEDEKHEDKFSTSRLSSDSKENLTAATTKKKKTTTTAAAESIESDVILLDDTDSEESGKEDVTKGSLTGSKGSSASPKRPIPTSNKRKGAGTPSASSSVGGKNKTSGGGSASKLQIKLPVSGKKKRRKSQRKSITDIEGNAEVEAKAESSDDIEMIADELNPQKRQKVDDTMAKQQFEDISSADQSETIKPINSTEVPSTKSTDSQNKTNLQNPQRRKSSRLSLPMVDKNTPASNSEKAEQVGKNSMLKDKIENPETKSDSNNDNKTSGNGSKKDTDQKQSKKASNILDMFVSNNGLIKQTKQDSVKKSESNIKTTDSPKSGSLSNFTAKTANLDDQADEADDDEDAADSASSNSPKQPDKKPKSDSKVTDSPASSSTSKLNNSSGPTVHRKGLTPKQQKQMEQRRQAREEKERRLQEQKDERERKLQEEKIQKQREKEEKELARKREREEKEEQKRKEREDKEEVKRKEREEKEMKRLAEIEAKNEERRKRNEVKEEELRKKEEERKRKELEKEEAENKKKKAAEAFTKFFKTKRSSIAPEDDTLALPKETVGDGVCNIESLAFRPFQVKGDMKLAPLCRKVFTDAAREKLDSFLCVASGTNNKKGKENTDLYLGELKNGTIKPEKWRRLTVDTKEDEDDVVIVENELERAAQAIVEEKIRPVERYRAKFYKFHENRRPPYFGTWRKKTKVITPRRPLAQDKEYFDYEVDSDLEWEEEEPGESLDGSDEEEKEKESEDEDYEVDNEWFVPHGHLSDEEMQNEDEYGLGDDNTREAQKAKLKILQQEFAQEMKKKTEKIKPRLVGCIWEDYNGNQPELCPNIIWDSLNLRAMICTAPPLIDEPVAEVATETNEPSSPTTNASGAATEKLKRIVLTDTMLKDLIRLIHGNRHSRVFLINEFIAYVEQSEDSIKNGDVRGPLKSVVREKIDEFALWQVIEAKNNLKTKKSKKKLCWLVSDEILKKYEMESLDMHNKWKYTLQPKFVENTTQSAYDSILIEEDSTEGATVPSESGTPTSSKKKVKHKTDGIAKFTKVLTAEEKVQQLQQKSESPKTIAASKTRTTSRSVTPSETTTATTPKSGSSTPTVKKRVPLLMSVARGQQIPTPAKNALISQFLKKNKKEDDQQNKSSITAMEVDEVVVLD